MSIRRCVELNYHSGLHLMSMQTWTVQDGGTPRTISVDHDWQSTKATIRVDGRVVVKPMSADESERDVVIGNRHYIIRRLPGDQWDLDISPETFVAEEAARRKTAHSTPLPEERGTGKRIAIVIGIVFLLAIVGGLIRIGRHGFAYLSVPWKAYGAPDATFKAKFPGDPNRKLESKNVNGDIWQIVSLTSEYKDHFYAVQHVDLQMVVTESQSLRIMNRFLTGWMEALGSKIESSEETTLARNPAMTFIGTVPAGTEEESRRLPFGATMRGILVLRDRRLFLVWTLAPSRDPVSSDLKEFMDAFEVPPPPPKPALVF